MSNYNDIEPLICDDEVFVEFIDYNVSLEKFDLVILPGSKLVIKDLKWLKQNGLFEQIKNYKKDICCICGGYEMMFKTLDDKYALENNESLVEVGFGFIPATITFEKEKILKKQVYDLFDCKIKGFEIHHGISKDYPLFFETKNFKGTFVHGIFDSDEFRTNYFKSLSSSYIGYSFKEYKRNSINTFVNTMKDKLDVQRILDNIL